MRRRRRRRRHALSTKYGSMHKVPRNKVHASFFVTTGEAKKIFDTSLFLRLFVSQKFYHLHTHTEFPLFFIFRPCDSEPPLLLSMRIPLDFNSGVGRKGETVCSFCVPNSFTQRKKEKEFRTMEENKKRNILFSLCLTHLW